MKRFLPFLVPILTLLVLVPIMLLVQLSEFAKIIGVVVVLLTSFALRFWLARANKLGMSNPKVSLNTNDKFYLDAHLPLYRSMVAKEKKEFTRRLTRVLAEFDFDCEREGLVSRDEGVAFSALFTLLLYSMDMKTQKGKIVVFTKNSEMKLFFQGKNPVLMVDFKLVEQELESVSRFEDALLINENLKKLVLDFNTVAVS